MARLPRRLALYADPSPESSCSTRCATLRTALLVARAILKHKVKNAVSYIVAFEEAVAAEARSRRFDGVVCGHIHKAEIRDIDGILYCNDGDWVESLTALWKLWMAS